MAQQQVKIHSNPYLVYIRKSTDDTENQKNSIPYQKMECLRFALQEQLPIVNANFQNFCTSGVITERHTGFKEDNNFTIKSNGRIQYKIKRPKFHQLIEVLHTNQFKGVIYFNRYIVSIIY
jgi:hypothetical protein